MNQWVRVTLSVCLMFLSVMMIAIGIQCRHELWAGVRTEELTIKVPTPPPYTEPAEPRITLESGQFSTGSLEMQDVYEITGKDGRTTGVPSGDYQVLDSSNKIWILKLCEAQNNSVLPKFKEGSIVNIIYTKEPNCYRFISAQLLKAAK